jgi:uncharacterized protein YutE (UPF0331/DUF86 family)
VVKKDLVAAKLAELAERAARVRAKCPASEQALAADPDALDIVSFNLMLSVQLCADIAAHITTDERWLPAKSLAESFTRLEEHAVLLPNTAERLRRAVGLRNVVAHGYGSVDPALVFSAATAGVSDLSEFAREVATWLANQS